MAEGRLIGQLTDAVIGYQATDNFSCDGFVPIDICSTTRYGDFTSTKTPITSPPVIIRWDAPSGTYPARSHFLFPKESRKFSKNLLMTSNLQRLATVMRVSLMIELEVLGSRNLLSSRRTSIHMSRASWNAPAQCQGNRWRQRRPLTFRGSHEFP